MKNEIKPLLKIYDIELFGDYIDFVYNSNIWGPYYRIIVKFILKPKNVSHISPKEVKHISEFLYLADSETLRFGENIETFDYDDVPIIKYLQMGSELGEFVANTMIDKAEEVVSEYIKLKNEN
jgi:hypothetical protein